ncbi:tRNA 2-thiocytidine(32) synthetase TtcA [candidate division KSB1 bacterium]|nr:tRNA 2-thiocytidine(32) synthetase TtcA [candidate division KSB1 bacterium]
MSRNLHEFLRKNMEIAINDFGMVTEGDRILVGLSGGADSFSLLHLLSSRKIYVSNNISIIAVHLDLGFDPENQEVMDKLRAHLTLHQFEFHIEKTDIGPLAHSDYNKLNPCFLCSRIRRKRIFELAEKYGCNKIAFGHHKDDIVETLLINIFYGREISTMKPKQDLFGGKYYIIRPLAYLWENMLKKYTAQQQFPVFETKCPTGEVSKRKAVKDILRQLRRDQKHIKENVFNLNYSQTWKTWKN